MKVSIALATYNGELFIQEQMRSLVRNVEQLPDVFFELVVSDDGSSDRTVELIESWSSYFSEVKIVSNPLKRGVCNNFISAISLCSGDIIFLSDQDDIWFDTKIVEHLKVYNSDKNISIVINDAEIWFAPMPKAPGSLVSKSKFNSESKDGIKSILCTGCCTSFRKADFEGFLKIPCDVVLHDEWLHWVGLHVGKRFVLDKVLQKYRRHESNVSSQLMARPNLFLRFWKSVADPGVLLRMQKKVALGLALREYFGPSLKFPLDYWSKRLALRSGSNFGALIHLCLHVPYFLFVRHRVSLSQAILDIASKRYVSDH